MKMSSYFRVAPAVTLLSLLIAHPAVASSINYGDFIDGTVMYLDVTETANTPGDTVPLFGAPSIIGNVLDFDPAGLTAVATSGAIDITDVQLNLTVQAIGDTTLQTIGITESGDYTLQGVGGAATTTSFGVAISGLTVLDVDGMPLATPVKLFGASALGSDNLSHGADLLMPWTLGMSIDIQAALSAAGVSFRFGATRIELAIDNQLVAISEDGTVAYIAKKDFSIDVGTSVVPLPLPALLLGSALVPLLLLGRRRS